jgi:hypothetical protein
MKGSCSGMCGRKVEAQEHWITVCSPAQQGGSAGDGPRRWTLNRGRRGLGLSLPLSL